MIGFLGNGKIGKPLFERLKEKYEIKQVKSIDDLFDIKTLIDFSSISAKNIVKEALLRKINVIMGTTGYDESEINEFVTMARDNDVLFENRSNYAENIELFYSLIDEFKNKKVILYEVHDIKKKDCPSGTAITIKKKLNIPDEKIVSIRKKDADATHVIKYETDSEEIILIHMIKNKNAFIAGFVKYFSRLVEENDQRII